MQYQIKELSLGEILDHAVKLTKNHFSLLFGIVSVLYLPVVLLNGIITVTMLPEMPLIPEMEDIAAYQEAAAQISIFTTPISFAFLLIVLPVTNAAVVDAVSRCYLQKEATVGGAFSHAFRILLPLIGTWILQWLAMFAGFFLLFIGMLIFGLWFLLSTHCVVIGGESGRAALSRSKKLMKGNMLTGVALSFILIVIQWGIAFGAYVIPQKHVAMLGQVVLGSVAFIFSTVCFVVFYFSCRCKNENFDLTLLAENIGAEAPTEAEPAL